MLGLGFQELLIILVIVLFLFGGKKLPEIASGLGKAVREFKRATSEPLEGEVTRKASTALPAETNKDGPQA